MNALDLCIVDIGRGTPAEGVHVTLERHGPGERQHVIGDGITGADGRVRSLVQDGTVLETGRYSVTCRVGPYFAAHEVVPLFPEIHLLLDLHDASTLMRLRLYISPQSHNVVREP